MSLSGLRQFQSIESPLTIIKNVFCVTIKSLFVPKIYIVYFKVYFKIYGVTNLETINDSTHTVHYLRSRGNQKLF